MQCNPNQRETPNMQPNALVPLFIAHHPFACRSILLPKFTHMLYHTKQRSAGKRIFEVNQNERLSTAMGAPVKSVTPSDCCWEAKSHAVGDNSNASLLKTVWNLTDLFKTYLQTETAMVLSTCMKFNKRCLKTGHILKQQWRCPTEIYVLTMDSIGKY